MFDDPAAYRAWLKDAHGLAPEDARPELGLPRHREAALEEVRDLVADAAAADRDAAEMRSAANDYLRRYFGRG